MEKEHVRKIAEGKMDPISMELFEPEKSVVVLGKRTRPQCTIETFFQPIKRSAPRPSPAVVPAPKPVLVEQNEDIPVKVSPFFSQDRQDDQEVREPDQPCVSLLHKLVPLDCPALSELLLEQLSALTCPKTVKVRTGLRAPV